MTLLQSLLHLTNFKNPLLRTLVPSVSAAYAIQFAFAIPSIVAQNERFYDFSGSLTFLSVTALSLYLPSLRTTFSSTAANVSTPLPSLFAPFTNPGRLGALNWRQVALSGAVVFWAVRPSFAALPPVKISDIVGILVYVAGFAFEITADWQKSKWMREKREKLHDEQFMTRGLWTVSPAFVALLLTKVSGIPLSEKKYDKRYGDRKDYQEWKKNTPKLIPKVF
ncbi:hypothetical protein COL154_005225 [Colletotrichum chrysophilum]|nr:hypothetical protein KNSL1_012906 [Colletotrichum chrysophilum]KAJ0363938.1 hypothetical protein COL154_005225 [Colletotrichum chrysophilum]